MKGNSGFVDHIVREKKGSKAKKGAKPSGMKPRPSLKQRGYTGQLSNDQDLAMGSSMSPGRGYGNY